MVISVERLRDLLRVAAASLDLVASVTEARGDHIVEHLASACPMDRKFAVS